MFSILALLLEKTANNIKKFNIRKQNLAFVKKYRLTDGMKHDKTTKCYNTYEGTNISLAKTLIDSGILCKADHICDIGCGAGIFLSFLWINGYRNLYGIELNKSLYDICISNLAIISCPTMNVYNGNAVEFNYNDNINVYYLFNPFYDANTYKKWLNLVYQSYINKKRKIKIISLFPTISFIIAIEESTWLKNTCKLYDENQVCARCVRYLVYESEE